MHERLQAFVKESYIFMLMEYVPGGSLKSWLSRHGSVDELEARQLFFQLIDALAYCHQKVLSMEGIYAYAALHLRWTHRILLRPVNPLTLFRIMLHSHRTMCILCKACAARQWPKLSTAC